uniref:Uncharacterized protein n=2 Tax=Oryza TaxID=4527 RepID=A0A0D3GEM4_9ORYZ
MAAAPSWLPSCCSSTATQWPRPRPRAAACREGRHPPIPYGAHAPPPLWAVAPKCPRSRAPCSGLLCPLHHSTAPNAQTAGPRRRF